MLPRGHRIRHSKSEYALIDLILLSKTKKVIGSKSSSYGRFGAWFGTKNSLYRIKTGTQFMKKFKYCMLSLPRSGSNWVRYWFEYFSHESTSEKNILVEKNHWVS